jgi:hypothetical protein
MWRILFITFLAAHGLVHIAVWAMPKPADGKEPPFDVAHSWLLGDARTLAISLAIVSAALFVVAALGLFGQADWWRTVAVVAGGVSIGLMTLFFNPWLLAGWGLSAGLIAGIAWFAWPSQTLVGA